ncbi:MAG: NifU family protein [Candidatus Chromulinivorax sp.]
MEENQNIFAQITQEIENLQPYAQSHGGKIKLIDVQKYTVFIRLEGACTTCPLSFYTVTFGIEQRLQKLIHPDVQVIIQD